MVRRVGGIARTTAGVRVHLWRRLKRKCQIQTSVGCATPTTLKLRLFCAVDSGLCQHRMSTEAFDGLNGSIRTDHYLQLHISSNHCLLCEMGVDRRK